MEDCDNCRIEALDESIDNRICDKWRCVSIRNLLIVWDSILGREMFENLLGSEKLIIIDW